MKRQIRLTESELHRLVESTVRNILKESQEDNSSFYLIVEISPQTQYTPEETEDYEKVSSMYDNGDIQGILSYMSQWDNGDGDGETINEIDEYEKVLFEDDNYILTVCPSKHFGWQGDAFFLYGKN